MSVDPPTISVRSATPSDYEICLALDHSCSTDYVWQVGQDTASEEMSVSFRTARLPRSMKVQYPRSPEGLRQSWQRHALYLVGEWDRMVVGYVNVREELSQDAAWIADLVVDQSHRLRGVGTMLLRGARQWATDRGFRRLIAETNTKNYPAIQFLQRRGLIFCGYNDLYYPSQDIAVFFGQTLR